MIRVEVVGRPAPKGSRVSGTTKTGRPYTYPASKYEAPWVAEVKAATALQRLRHEMVAPPYAIDLSFRLPRSARATKGWPSAADLDKLARAVIDGLVAGGAMTDDRDVTILHAAKEYVPPGEQVGVTASIYHDPQIEQADEPEAEVVQLHAV